MNTLYLFDIDCTLTPPKQPMLPEHAERFLAWIGNKTIGTVSGGTIDHLKEQVPEEIVNQLDYVFACSGNDIYKRVTPKAKLENIERKLFPTNDLALTTFLSFELKHCNCPLPKGNINYEYRPGLLNFSIVGRDANQEMRDAYQAWDIQDGERKRIVSYINSKFPQYQASIGGQISVDIVEKGNDKAQVLDYIDLTKYRVKFYGDRIIDEGNDWSLASKIFDLQCGHAYHVTGPEDLLSKLGA